MPNRPQIYANHTRVHLRSILAMPSTTPIYTNRIQHTSDLYEQCPSTPHVYKAITSTLQAYKAITSNLHVYTSHYEHTPGLYEAR